MNSALHISYDDLLRNYASNRQHIDPTTGDVDMTVGAKRTFAVWASNAMKEAWDKPRGKDWVWPFSVQSSSSVTVTDGVITLADLSYPVWFSLWSAEPRPASSNAYRVPIRLHDSSGIYPQCDLGSVFALYVPRAPEFDSRQWTDLTAYAAGAVRYDSTTGQCWRAKIAVPASPSIPLSNSTYWEEQLIPKNFNDYLTLSTVGMYHASVGQTQTADVYAARAQEDLEREFIAAFRDSPSGSGKPLYAGGLWR